MAKIPTMTTTPVTATMHSESTTVHAVPTTGRSRGDSSSGQSECSDGCERDLAKHFLYSPLRGVIA
jgi:hypothetical protein